MEPSAQRRAQLLRDLSQHFEMELRDPARALTALLAAYREHPQRDAWRHLDRLAALADGWSELIAEMAASEADLAPADGADLWSHIGAIYEKWLEQPSQALDSYRRAIEIDDGCVTARQRIEALLRARGDHAALVALLEQRVGAAPELERRAIRVELAQLYEQLGHRKEAIGCYEELREESPGDLGVLRILERLYTEEQRSADLVNVLEAQAGQLQGARDLVRLYRRMAVEWEQQLGSAAKAAECFEWVLTYQPGCEEAFAALERLYRAGGKWQAAVDAYCRHAAIVPPARRAELYAEVARICERHLGDASGAIDFYRRVDADRPALVDAMTAPIRLYERSEDFTEVVALLERRALRVEGRERADLYHRASELARQRLDDAALTEQQLLRALEADAAHVPSLAALAEIYRERGDLLHAAKLLHEASVVTANRREGARLRVQEAELRRQLGDAAQAIALYAEVLDIDPDHVPAAASLVELLEAAGDLPRLRAPLELLVAKESAEKRPARLLQLARVEEQLGEPKRALAMSARALALAPTDSATLCAHAALLLRHERFAPAHELFAQVAAQSDGLPSAEKVELYAQLGRCALALHRRGEARDHFAAALALDGGHRPSLRALIELDQARPAVVLLHYRALLVNAPPEEERALVTNIGDLCARQDDREGAAAAYRRALTLAPDDHRLLHKLLDVCAQRRAWDEALAPLKRLIHLERVATVRARYLQAAGMICRDELGRIDDAIRLLSAAVADDPYLERSADALVEMWSERGDWLAIAVLHQGRLQRLGTDGDVALRARIWSQLGELCLQKLDDRQSALDALQAAATLEPRDSGCHRLLAELCEEADPERAVVEHELVTVADPGAHESYAALERLHRRAGRTAQAEACAEALAFLEQRRDGVPAPERDPAAVAVPALSGARLSPELWAGLQHPHEDSHLSALFTLLAPFVAATQAQTSEELGLTRRDQVASGDPRGFARALDYVARAFGVPAPRAFVRYGQQTPARLLSCIERKRLTPTVLIGNPLLGNRRCERELVFHLARQLAHLRSGRVVRLFWPHPARLAQLVELAMAPATNELDPLVRRLQAALPPLVLDQMASIGERLRGQVRSSAEAVLVWLRATDLTASRVALFLIGDLPLCARLAASESVPYAALPDERVLDLAAASVSRGMFAARSANEHRH